MGGPVPDRGMKVGGPVPDRGIKDGGRTVCGFG